MWIVPPVLDVAVDRHLRQGRDRLDRRDLRMRRPVCGDGTACNRAGENDGSREQKLS
jgi:hypothetical protein